MNKFRGMQIFLHGRKRCFDSTEKYMFILEVKAGVQTKFLRCKING